MAADRFVWLEPLGPQHDVDRFTSGCSVLDEYLRVRGLLEQRAAKVRTYVVSRYETVVAYVTLAPGVIETELRAEEVRQRLRRRTIPVIALCRIAVDAPDQRNGLGKAVLFEAIRRSVPAAEVIGARAIVTHALGGSARSFFEKNGFDRLPGDPYRLSLPLPALPSAGRGIGSGALEYNRYTQRVRIQSRAPESRGGDMVSTGLMSEFG